MEVHVNNEELYQKIHELQRALNISETIRENLQQDLETLQNQLNSHETKFQEYKCRNETELANKWMEKVSLLRSELDEERKSSAAIISDLKNKINTLENREIIVNENSDNENLKDQLLGKDDEIVSLKKQIVALNETLDASKQESDLLNTKLKNLGEMYEETLQILQDKKESLSQATEALKDIQDEKTVLTNEIALLKAGTVDDQRRGNSLFAEVDDNRQLLMQKVSFFKTKLADAKIKLNNKNSEVFSLKAENDRLHYRIQEMDRVLKPEHLKFINAYKTRISELEILVNNLKKQAAETVVPTNQSHCLEWLFNSLERERKEHRDLQQEFNKISQQHLMQAETHFSEIERLKKELTSTINKYTKEINELAAKISAESSKIETDIPDSNMSNGKTQERVPSKGVRFADD